MTNRAKWVFHPFGFLKGHILQKADVVHTAAFSTSTASATRIPDKSRGSSIGTDMENMDPSIQALSQPSFSAATTSTPHQSQDTCFSKLFQQTQSLLSDFMKYYQQQQNQSSSQQFILMLQPRQKQFTRMLQLSQSHQQQQPSSHSATLTTPQPQKPC